MATNGRIPNKLMADNAINTAEIVDGALAASAAGRAKMADGFLSADSTGRAKVADGFVSTAKLADGAMSADSTGRAKVATGFFDAATVTDKFASTSIGLGLLAEPVLRAGGGQALTANLPAGGFKITGLGDGSAASDAATKGQLDAALLGLKWKDPVAVLQLVGNAAASTIEGLTPTTGDAYVVSAADGAGALSAAVVGDIWEYSGSAWVKVVPGAGGFVLAGTRAILATQTALITPYTDATDDGKIAEFSGASLTGSLATPSDAWAVIVDAEAALYENQGYVYDGTVPSGTWVRISGPLPYAGSGEMTAVNGGDTASGGASASVARGDHQHAVATAAAGSAAVGDAAAEGVSTSLARADHKHAIQAGTPVGLGAANAEGDSTNFARANHVHVRDTETQEAVATQVITGTDTAMTDTLDHTPTSAAAVKLYYYGVLMAQGAGKDYTVSGSTITWLAATGTAPDMTAGEPLVAVYSY